ncbi:putative exported protein [Hyphomicrobium sulfonivorans]|uniref:Putative exported protein n=1 Tax=Hyphomicrobium sulfonivorans TaxID=121290 RepID=A0A125NVD3_HYPSL|nr:DUF1513 domain-containing protein [Hyphomicrobium sulfonivorans]KWT69435.1 putative exported protein [Hyphomicrobium sulfonivorans]
MAIDRRQLLIGAAVCLASTAAAAHFGTAIASAAAADDSAFDSGIMPGDLIAACRRPDGGYSVVIMSLDGTLLHEVPLEGRGHDIALDHASGRAVVFARRPGTFALSFDIHDRKPPSVFTTPANRHFYGHGVFSRDGRLLYATEHDNDTRDGLIGVYDVAGGFRRIGEFPSYGIGPHEVILLADGTTLAIANGGIETHVETGREKLNLSSMEPSLAFVDCRNGRLLAQHKQSAELHRLSIRHLAQDARGTVWFGCQWEGENVDSPDLVGCAGLDAPLRIIAPPKPMGASLAGYIGSVAVSGDGRLLAASAPRAGRIVYIDTERQQVVGESQLADSCGVTGMEGPGFAMTSGYGIVQTEQPDHTHLTTTTFPGRAFDNHVRVIG